MEDYKDDNQILVYCGATTMHEGHHEAIVDRETFELAERNIQQHSDEKGTRVGAKQKRHAFSGKLTCAHCGATLKRNSMKYHAIYTCPNRCGCEPEENIKNAFITCLNKLVYSQKQNPEKRILDVYIGEIGEAEQQGIMDRLREIDATLQENQLEADVLTAVALVNHFTPEEHAKKMELLKENDALRREKVMLGTCATSTVKAERLKTFVTHWDGGAFPDEAFPDLVESATVHPVESVTFHFACGLDLKEALQ